MRLIKGRESAGFIVMQEIRDAIMRSVAVEGSRGWKIDKIKQSHKIDIVISLGMAALAAVRAQSEAYDYSMKWLGYDEDTPNNGGRSYAAQRLYGALQGQITMMNYPPMFGRGRLF